MTYGYYYKTTTGETYYVNFGLNSSDSKTFKI